MRVANHRGRLSLVMPDGLVDVETVGAGRFGHQPELIFDRWAEFHDWAASVEAEGTSFDEHDLEAPSPRPRQTFGIGLNYADHAAEGGIPIPEFPSTFAKFASCITGQHTTVKLPSATVDWEVELVVVIGAECSHVPTGQGWSRVAGLTVGQDLSDRVVQMRPPVPQFNLGKSFTDFGPTGPWIVTPDELADPNDLAIGCTLNGTQMQASRTKHLIFNVPTLIELLSSIVTLYPGDLIFTGTPAGVGATRDPKHFIVAGDELVSTIEGIGTLHTHFA